MASPKSPKAGSVCSPKRTADKPPVIAALSSGPSPAGGAWHALLVGRTQEEIAAIVRAGVMLLAQGWSVQPQPFQQCLTIDGDHVTVNRWTKSTVAQFKHYTMEPDTTRRYDMQEISSLVKVRNNYYPLCRPLPTENTARVGGGHITG